MKVAQKLLLFIAPIAASSTIVALPSQAATFALSQGEVAFFNFNRSPSSTNTTTSTQTRTIGEDVEALADAKANLLVNPPLGFNSSISQAKGTGSKYFGFARSEAQLIGDFAVKDVLSFNFGALLGLATSTDSPQIENAQATGSIQFVLLDKLHSYKTLDSFNLQAGLDTAGTNNFLYFAQTDNIHLTDGSLDYVTGNNASSVKARVIGSYERTFATPTQVRLVEVKTNRAIVKRAVVDEPEPSSLFALIICGSIGVFLKRWRARSF
jgi:hypothetical protein